MLSLLKPVVQRASRNYRIIDRRNSLFSSRAFSAAVVSYSPVFTPSITPKSRLVIPISMGRYDSTDKKRDEYDAMLNSLFSHTARLLQQGIVVGVDVISTAGLQRINWDADKVQAIESHFLKQHKTVLSQQTNLYRWESWIDQMGRGQFNKYYNEIVELSRESTEWHNLMVKTHETVKMSGNLDLSLEYQRREYAAIMLMSGYDQLVYTGNISLAWSYIYHAFRDLKLPVFTKVAFEKENKKSSIINTSDANHTTKLILTMIEQTLTSPNFPNSEKKKIINMGMSLFYAYEPRKHGKPTSVKQNDCSSLTT